MCMCVLGAASAGSMRMWARKALHADVGDGVAQGGAGPAGRWRGAGRAGGAPVIKVLRGARQLRAARAARQHGAGRLAVLRRQVLRLGRMDGWVDRRIDG